MEPNKFIQKLKNEDGAALVLAMMVLMVLSILGAMVGTLTVGSYRLSDNNQEYNSAYYIAEAGANMAYEEIENKIIKTYKESENSSAYFASLDKPFNQENLITSQVTYSKDHFNTQFGQQPEAIVELIGGEVIEVDGSEGKEKTKKYVIESTGQIDGKSRTVEKDLSIKWVDKESNSDNLNVPKPPSGEAVIFANQLHLIDQNKVNGNLLYVGSYTGNPSNRVILGYQSEYNNINSNAQISLNNYHVKLEEYFPDVYPSHPIKPTRELETLDNGNKNQLSLNQNTYIRNLEIGYDSSGKPRNLEIIIPNKEINLVVDKLVFKQNNDISVIGNGTLNIFVNNNITIGQDVEIRNRNESNSVNLIYNGTNDVTLFDNFILSGSIYSTQASVKLNYNARMTGNIVVQRGNIILGQKSILNGNLYTKKGNVTLDSEVVLTGNIFAEEGNITTKHQDTINGDIKIKKGNITFGGYTKTKGNLFLGNGILTTGYNPNVEGIVITNGKMNLGSSTIFNGLAYSNGHEILFNDAAKINGAVISGTGNTVINQNSTMHGTIVANNVKFLYGTSITYSEDYLKYYNQNSSDNNNQSSDINIANLILSTPAVEKQTLYKR